MRRGGKELLVVGDRVLIEVPEGEQRTKVGLLLPASALEKEEVLGGVVVAKGPGSPLPPPQEDDEPWKTVATSPRYLPMQVEIGDTAIFFRKAAIEITFDEKKYLVVPHQAILVLVREKEDGERDVPDALPEEL